jgi:hypothetical protein
MVILSHLMEIPGQYLKIGHDSFFHQMSNSIFTNPPVITGIVSATDTIAKLTINKQIHRGINKYIYVTYKSRSRVSSGSIVSDYGLDDRASGVRSSAGAKDFSSSLCVQTGSGAPPASCTLGTGGPFPGGKARPGRDADHSPLSSAEVVN